MGRILILIAALVCLPLRTGAIGDPTFFYFPGDSSGCCRCFFRTSSLCHVCGSLILMDLPSAGQIPDKFDPTYAVGELRRGFNVWKRNFPDSPLIDFRECDECASGELLPADSVYVPPRVCVHFAKDFRFDDIEPLLPTELGYSRTRHRLNGGQACLGWAVIVLNDEANLCRDFVDEQERSMVKKSETQKQDRLVQSNGAVCFPLSLTAAHEGGHVLGLHHACGDGAKDNIMAASAACIHGQTTWCPDADSTACGGYTYTDPGPFREPGAIDRDGINKLYPPP